MLCALFLPLWADREVEECESGGELSHNTRSMGVRLRCPRDVSSPVARRSARGSLPNGVWGHSLVSFVADLCDRG